MVSRGVMIAHGALFALGFAAMATTGCGGDQKGADMDQIFVPGSAVEGNDYGKSSAHDPPPSDNGNGATSGMNDEQKDQIRNSLKRGGANAAQCIMTVPGAKTTGEGEVQVTFDGGTGHVSDASVGAPFAGSEIEACIKKAFMAEYSLKFDGPPLTVPYTVKIDKPGGPDSGKKPGKKP